MGAHGATSALHQRFADLVQCFSLGHQQPIGRQGLNPGPPRLPGPHPAFLTTGHLPSAQVGVLIVSQPCLLLQYEETAPMT